MSSVVNDLLMHQLTIKPKYFDTYLNPNLKFINQLIPTYI